VHTYANTDTFLPDRKKIENCDFHTKNDRKSVRVGKEDEEEAKK
jgi:hypothetical protein